MKRTPVVAALLAALLPAQAPPVPAADLSPVIPIHTAPADPDGGEYGIWAAGRGFKVSFHDGVEVHARVGTHGGGASWRYRLVSCRLGARELLAAERSPAPRWTPARCAYDHGPVVETYDLRAEGVEQKFVLAQRPEGGGDLVLAGEVTTPLAPRWTHRPGAALQLCDAQGRWLLEYGAATAIAADGARCAVRTEIDGTQLRLVVDGGWLEHAAWPVVVDPLVRPNVSLGLAERVVGVDVFRDDEETQRNLWLAVTTEDGAGDRDLFVRRCDEDFTNGVDVFVDLTSAWSADGARLCGVGGARKVVAVFTRDFGTERGVRWHLHDKASTTAGTAVGILPRPTGTHDWRPDVGGTRAFSVGSRALVVWQRETAGVFAPTPDTRVFGALLDTAAGGNGSLSPPFRLDARDDFDQEDATVNPEAEGGAAFSWVTAWRARNPNSLADMRQRVFARRVDHTGLFGNRFDAPLAFVLNGTGHSAPHVAGSGGRYLLAYGDRPHTTGSRELLAIRLDWPHGEASGTRVHGTTTLEVDTSLDAVIDAIAFDTNTRSHWVLTRRELTFNTLRVTKLGFRGRIVEVDDLEFGGSEVVTASGTAFDDDTGRFVVVGGVRNFVGSQQGRLVFDAMRYDDVAFPAEYGTACGSGRVRWNGSQHVGDEFPVVDLIAAAPARGTVLAIASAAAAVPLAALGAPNCTLLVDAFGPTSIALVAGVTDAGGRLPLALPLPEHVPPGDLRFQAFQLAPDATSLGLTATRALHVPIGR